MKNSTYPHKKCEIIHNKNIYCEKLTTKENNVKYFTTNTCDSHNIKKIYREINHNKIIYREMRHKNPFTTTVVTRDSRL